MIRFRPDPLSVNPVALACVVRRIVIQSWIALCLALPLTALAAPPANDNFANAVVLTGSSGSASGTNVEATSEAGEPRHAQASGKRSVWWRWTATGSGVVTFDTAGSDFDTVMAVYTGAAVDNLTLIAEGDDTAFSVFTSRVAFQATAGVTYNIAVDGFSDDGENGDTGPIVLSWALGGAAPANDNFANASFLGGGTVVGSNVNATKQPGEPWHAGVAGGRSVWWRWTAPSSANYTINTAGSGFDTLLAVYTGSDVANLMMVAFDDDDGELETSRVGFAAVAGTTYYIAVDGYGFQEGSISLSILEDATQAPSNDAFSARSTIPTGGGSVTGTSIAATKEAGEPAHAGNAGGRSVWWAWTAAADATIQISTAGSTFDTLLAVYTGAAVNALTEIASNDDESLASDASYVTFDAVAGSTYQIAVDGFDGGSGAINLSLSIVNFAPAPPVANPALAATSGEFIANWAPAAGATGYRLDVSTNSSFVTFVPGYNNRDVGNTTLELVSGLAPSTTHYYRVRGYNSVGQGLSSSPIPVNTAAAAFAGLVNISTLAVAGSNDATLIVGFFIEGTGSKTLVIRGVGPQLAKDPFNRSSVVADPRITLYREEIAGSTIIGTNDDWDPSLAADFNAVGAFPLDTGSKDAAMKVTLTPGRYTVHLVNGGPPAEAIIEVYDRSKEMTSRLVNLSCRLNLGAGQTVIVGAYQENRIGSLLMRNIGPTLATYNVQGTLPDPELALFVGSTLIDRNDDWDNSLAQYFSPAGAFALDAGSKDAVLRGELLPGAFTMHATGKGQSGVILVELYESN